MCIRFSFVFKGTAVEKNSQVLKTNLWSGLSEVPTVLNKLLAKLY
jgi:hypothetical protein